jgi:hypothetical protein
MHPRVYALLTAFFLLPTVNACSDNPADWAPLVTAIGRAAPAIASAAPSVVETVKKLQPSPTPTPKPVGVRAVLDDMTIKVGDTRDILPYLRDFDGMIPLPDELNWDVSNPSILTINRADGTIRGGSAGKAVVYAFLRSNGANRAQITIEVLDTVLVRQVTIIPARLALPVGESRRVRAEVEMADGEINSNVNWSSSDSTIAQVNPTTGEVNPLKPGRVTIVASYAVDSRYKGLLDLSVREPEEATAASPAVSPAPVTDANASAPTPTL